MRADPAGGPAGDDLDAIWEIADESAFPASYVADRRAAIDRFRRANGEHLARWHEPGADWRAFYRRERNRDRLALAAIILGLVIALAIVRRRRVGWRGAALALAWMAAVIAVTCALHVAVRGSFDFTSINRRAAFIRVTGALCAACATLGFAAHWLIWRDPRRWLHDQLALALLGLAVGLAHIVAFGWPLGFPLPGAALLFLPFFAALFTLVHAGVAALGFAASAARAALRARI